MISRKAGAGEAGAGAGSAAVHSPGASLRLPLVRPSRPADPALRSAADMCAAGMPLLSHIFRGTFVHATWTCPMEVLRDHLLGVSDSGKVSKRARGLAQPDGRAGGRKEWRAVPCEPRARSVQSECQLPSRTRGLGCGGSRKAPGGPGRSVFLEAKQVSQKPGALGRQPSRLSRKGSEAVPSQILRDCY